MSADRMPNSRGIAPGNLDGGFGTEQTPLNLDSIADLGRIGGRLAAPGFLAADIEGFYHGNFVGFLRRTLPA